MFLAGIKHKNKKRIPCHHLYFFWFKQHPRSNRNGSHNNVYIYTILSSIGTGTRTPMRISLAVFLPSYVYFFFPPDPLVVASLERFFLKAISCSHL